MNNITDESYIALICNGEFNAIPDFKIGELFESFFDNINYNLIREDENIFVDFTGEAECDDEPCTILIRFAVDKNAEEFEIVEVRVDDDILNEDEVLDLLEDIAYVGGAVVNDEYFDCDEDCSACMHDCHNLDDEEENEEPEEDENNSKNNDENDKKDKKDDDK